MDSTFEVIAAMDANETEIRPVPARDREPAAQQSLNLGM